ncbi:MAG: ABC transporter ATP-binding protein [Flavobacteriales bacterium]|nr:ABC transporter ATP-binding protein [Flavobacteriales bacterium]
MIKAVNIHKSFGSLEVLRGVSLEVAPREIVSIVGPSGAGKTTLLQILGTLDTPTPVKGMDSYVQINSVRTDGMKDKTLSAFRNKNIGFIFQFHRLLPEFSAIENVCLPAMISGKSLTEAKKEASEILDFLSLSHRYTHYPNELSGGEQQRVSVARALICHPEVIFADEPSGNLDSHNADELHRLFLSLRDTFGQTFVIVTHNHSLADMADRRMEMRDGMIENIVNLK